MSGFIGATPLTQAAYDRPTPITGVTGTTINFTYNPNFLQVFMNGVLLSKEDYTATDGLTVTFTQALVATDIIELIAMSTFNVADTYSRAVADSRFAKLNGDNTQNFKVANAVNVDEALSKGQLLAEIQAVDGSGSGLDADLLRGLPADFTSSKATNGYQKLPSGLIIQWGEYTSTMTHGSTYTVSFPISFPVNCAQVVGYVTNTVDTTVTLISCPLTASTLSNFTFQYGSVDGSTYTTTIRYIAIGY